MPYVVFFASAFQNVIVYTGSYNS